MGDVGAGRRALHVLGWRLTPDMPPARLLAASAINWFGSGLFHSSVAVFAVAVLPVGPATVGLAFALGGVAGILLSVMVGRFADRHDAKAVLVGAYAVQGMLFVLYAAGVHDRATFLAATVAVQAVDVATPALSQAVIASLATGTGRVRYLALQRSVINAAIGIGALVAAVLLIHPTRAAFAVVLAVDGVSYWAAAVLVRQVPAERIGAPGERRRWLPSWRLGPAALRGRAALVRFALLDGILCLNVVILNVGLPLWLTLRTDAPSYLVGLLYFVNTALVVLFQTRVTDATTGFARAARGELVVGVALLGSCTAIGLAGGVSAVVATQLLVAGVLLLTLAELVHSSVSWQVALDQTQRGGRAGGLAIYGVGRTTAQLAGPLLLSAIVAGRSAAAWAGLGAVLLAAGVTFAALLGHSFGFGPTPRE